MTHVLRPKHNGPCSIGRSGLGLGQVVRELLIGVLHEVRGLPQVRR
eukprot:CAMPEP_0177404772 /NCGR_PEP_ID=MMETSP0368-20130122/61596_1 /TAXON_ID=447022 ORGANISM="Scrippsiella hangoei-like, Strain SHHI-4" /NCGR_SAMPLE_ID=MMETSP0368 /ASSEMBLY_ACC=CAM_ASM_000363 /LENGTH=45 /DNA_ID= /DNA_START= /DNA_END= /DNA_ORIENTATION=